MISNIYTPFFFCCIEKELKNNKNLLRQSENYEFIIDQVVWRFYGHWANGL